MVTLSVIQLITGLLVGGDELKRFVGARGHGFGLLFNLRHQLVLVGVLRRYISLDPRVSGLRQHVIVIFDLVKFVKIVKV